MVRNGDTEERKGNVGQWGGEGARVREAEGRGMLRAQGSRAGDAEKNKAGPHLHHHHCCPSSSPNIQTLYSGIGRRGVVSLVAGEQEPRTILIVTEAEERGEGH